MGRKSKASKASKDIISYLFSLTKKLIKNFKKIPVFLQLVILLSLILLFFKRKTIETFQGSAKGEITFFHMNGCGHCSKMKPEWDNFEQNWNDNELVVNNKEQGEARDLCKKYNIRGFPTIVFTINGEIPEKATSQEHVYNGDRTASDLERWAKEMKETFL